MARLIPEPRIPVTSGSSAVDVTTSCSSNITSARTPPSASRATSPDLGRRQEERPTIMVDRSSGYVVGRSTLALELERLVDLRACGLHRLHRLHAEAAVVVCVSAERVDRLLEVLARVHEALVALVLADLVRRRVAH